jgi:hypothetical protein
MAALRHAHAASSLGAAAAAAVRYGQVNAVSEATSAAELVDGKSLSEPYNPLSSSPVLPPVIGDYEKGSGPLNTETESPRGSDILPRLAEENRSVVGQVERHDTANRRSDNAEFGPGEVVALVRHNFVHTLRRIEDVQVTIRNAVLIRVCSSHVCRFCH